MNTESKIKAAREYYDTHSAEDEIAAADLVSGDAANTSPMSGYSVRLPTDVLDQARKLASERGMTTGAWLREAIENAVASNSSSADAVPVTDLLALVARHHQVKSEAETTATELLDEWLHNFSSITAASRRYSRDVTFWKTGVPGSAGVRDTPPLPLPAKPGDTAQGYYVVRLGGKTIRAASASNRSATHARRRSKI